MPLTKHQKRKNAIIQKEQTQLIKIETELENLMSTVNEAINALKVDELQLKSNVFMYETPKIKTENLPSEFQSYSENQQIISHPYILPTTSSEINQQEIDLDVLNIPFDSDIEEFDDI